MCLLFSCKSKHDKLMNQLNSEELQRSLFLDTVIKHRDSLIRDQRLSTDMDFAKRTSFLDYQLSMKDRSIAELKERIMLEK